jgi:hypothetical protein
MICRNHPAPVAAVYPVGMLAPTLVALGVSIIVVKGWAPTLWHLLSGSGTPL